MDSMLHSSSLAYRSFCFCAGIVSVSTDYCINLFVVLPFLIAFEAWLKKAWTLGKQYCRKFIARYSFPETDDRQAYS